MDTERLERKKLAAATFSVVTEEESSYHLNAIDGLIIMDTTKFCINARALADLRLVSKSFAAFIENSTPMINNLVFHVCGKHPNYKSKNGDVIPSPMRILTDSTVKWAHVKFSYLDLEADLIRHQDPFAKFLKICNVLKSLTMINTNCSMGHFVEILTSCTGLEELKLVNCSRIFETGFEIINWFNFIVPFQNCLAKIKHITIIDGRKSASVITTEMMVAWYSNMQQLVSLDIRSSFGEFPIDTLMRVIARNQSTLRHLSFLGQCKISDRMLDTLARLSLRSLLLGNVVMDNGLDNFFLKTQEKCLESLHLYNMTIQRTCLDTIGYMEKLKKLHLEDVHVVGGDCSKRSDANTKHPFTNLVTLTDLRLQNSLVPTTCLPWTPLFQQMPTFFLTTLALRFKDVNILVNLFPQPFLKYLKVLVVVGIGKPESSFFGPAFQKYCGADIVRKALSMTSLEKLEITDSSLSDGDFPFPGTLAYNDLGSFKHLKMLNLSRTRIGDIVLLRHIPKLANLEALYVDKTEVTYDGFMKLANFRKVRHILPKLRMVSATNCLGVRVQPHEVTRLTEQLSRVQLYF